MIRLQLVHSRARPWLRHPSQVIVVAFAVRSPWERRCLSLPVSRAGADGTSLLTALFTATSAVCVTGLVTVDTAAHWSQFGELVILALIQVGGFGIMTRPPWPASSWPGGWG